MVYKKITYKYGFTIVELLVVIVVIGILAAITIVSYTGITNRATIASIQSDLTNASTTLKMDQTINDNFPATLALANSGKGITQSQSLDSIIYVPDNVSNPNNFCLQYRKGTNTYAVDNNSQPTKGVCLNNLVTNGDFSGGTSGWLFAQYTASISGPKAILTGVDGGSRRWENPQTGIPVSTNSKIYWRFKQKTPVEANDYKTIALMIGGSERGTGASVIADGVERTYSGVHDSTTASGICFFRVYQMSSPTSAMVGKITELSGPTIIDLTAVFGAGNEPTQAQMDTIMSNYPNSWFNIVAKASL